MPDEELTVEFRGAGDHRVLKVRGNLGLAAAGRLRAALADVAASEPGALTVDLTDAGGVHVLSFGLLVVAARRLRSGSELIVSGPSRLQRWLISLCRLDRLVKIA